MGKHILIFPFEFQNSNGAKRNQSYYASMMNNTERLIHLLYVYTLNCLRPTPKSLKTRYQWIYVSNIYFPIRIFYKSNQWPDCLGLFLSVHLIRIYYKSIILLLDRKVQIQAPRFSSAPNGPETLVENLAETSLARICLLFDFQVSDSEPIFDFFISPSQNHLTWTVQIFSSLKFWQELFESFTSPNSPVCFGLLYNF